MKRLKNWGILVGLLCCGLAAAQVRTAGDSDARAFVIGLDAYVYNNGPLRFSAAGRSFTATPSGASVALSGAASATLPFGTADLLVGIHDFTGDQEPELVVGERLPSGVKTHVYRLSGGSWQEIGSLSIPGGTECSIYRQALTVKDPSNGVLHSWTWHGDRFDYKSSENGSSY